MWKENEKREGKWWSGEGGGKLVGVGGGGVKIGGVVLSHNGEGGKGENMGTNGKEWGGW